MKIAIPVFQTKVSPRFDQAQEFVFLETEKARVVASKKLTAKGLSVTAKMKQLVDLGIDTLICGGIGRASLQYLSFNGVKVYSWVTGDVNDAVACFLENRMKPGIILGEQGEIKGRWQFCKGRNHVCNIYQPGFNKKRVKAMPRGDGTGPRGQGARTGRGRGGCKAGKTGRGSGQAKDQGFGPSKEVGSPQDRASGVKGRGKGNNA